MASAVSIDDFNTSLTLLLREIKSYIGNKFLEEIGSDGLNASIGTYLSEHISDIVNGTNINPIVKNFIQTACAVSNRDYFLISVGCTTDITMSRRIVPPILEMLFCSSMRSITLLAVRSSISVVFASCRPSTSRAYSMTMICIPRQMPK